MAETALVVPVPAADAAVMGHRRRFTPSGSEGLPAHVTVLTPWLDSGAIETQARVELETELASHAPFAVSFVRVARFPGSPEVLHAVPEPAAPFVALTNGVWQRFGLPPYGGEHETVIPHLTIATGDDPALLDEIEAEVARRLPIDTRAEVVELWEHRAQGWTATRSFPLGGR